MNDLGNIPVSFSTVSCNLINLLLYGDDNFDGTKNWETSLLTVRLMITNFQNNLSGYWFAFQIPP